MQQQQQQPSEIPVSQNKILSITTTEMPGNNKIISVTTSTQHQQQQQQQLPPPSLPPPPQMQVAQSTQVAYHRLQKTSKSFNFRFSFTQNKWHAQILIAVRCGCVFVLGERKLELKFCEQNNRKWLSE